MPGSASATAKVATNPLGQDDSERTLPSANDQSVHGDSAKYRAIWKHQLAGLKEARTQEAAPARTSHFHNGMNEGLDYAPHRFGADENDLD
jgi:hypothetical protein